MKKLFAAFTAIILSVFARNANAQVLSEIEGMIPYKLGATVGLNIPYFSFSGYQYTAGVQVGLNLMLDGSEILPNTFGRAELKYSMKGAYFEGIASSSKFRLEERYTTHYLEIPLHAGYAWYINEDWSVMAEGGPYFAIGLGGSRESNEKMHPSQSFFGELGCSRFDFGLGVQLSAMFMKDYQLHVAYDWGLLNMKYTYLQNRNISVGLTYFFE